MRAGLVTIAACLVFGGCATTKTKPSIEVRAAKMVEKPDFDTVGAHEKAKKLLRKGAYIKAYNEYQNLLQYLPKCALERDEALLEFAETSLALAGQGTHYRSQAREIFKDLAQKQELPDEDKNRISAGQALLAAMDKSVKSPIDIIEAVLESRPKDARLWNALGRAHDQNSDWLGALDAYLQALNVTHKSKRSRAPVYNNMGMSLLMQGRTKEALVKFKRARKGQPDIKIYENNYYLALILSDNLASKLGGLEDSRLAQLYNDAGYIAAGKGERIHARTYYNKAIEISPVYFEKAVENLAALDELKREDA